MHIDDLKKWYQQWYTPNNTVIVVVGDVQADQVYQLAKKYFGKIRKREVPVVKPQA